MVKASPQYDNYTIDYNLLPKSLTIDALTIDNLTVPDILTAGNVGIGTTIPVAPLHLYHTGAGDILRIDDQTAPDATPFLINQNGNVGIGTTDPYSRLTINGSTTTLHNQVNGLNTSLFLRNTSLATAGEGQIFLLGTPSGLRDAGCLEVRGQSTNWPRVAVFNPQFFGGVHSYATNLSGTIANGATWATGVNSILSPYRSELPYGLYAVCVNYYTLGGNLVVNDYLSGTVHWTGNFQSWNRQHFSGTNQITIVSGDLQVLNGTGASRQMRLMLSPLATYLYEV